MQPVNCALCGAAASVVRFELTKGTDSPWFFINECQDCGHVYMNPRPTETELAAFYTKDYHYDAFYSEHFAKQARQFYQELQRVIPAQSKLLDVGCSKGYFLHFAKQAGHQVTGIEYSADAAAYAKDNFDIDVKVGSVDAVELPAHSFDVITAFDLIEHVPDFQATLKRFQHWLKPGGLLIIDTPNYDSIYRKLTTDRWVGFDMPFHIHLFRPKTLRRALVGNGFKIKQTTTSHFNILSREGLIRSKMFGLLTIAVKLLRLTGAWERAQKSYWVQPVAHQNQPVNQTVGETGYHEPKITVLDILEAGLNKPINKIVADRWLMGDGLRVIAQT
ncbi:MAG: class I SAM-dependent methyltransferase [bacterium]|nr:class I SAM-dependent methyltransferase [bacterium]